MAAVNTEEIERECFKKGAQVEVNLEEPGFRGSWFTGTVIRAVTKKTRKLFIEFDTLRSDDGSKPLRELVDVILARPIPPRERFRSFKFEEVDAYYNDGWWEGVITGVHEDDRYTVYFRPSKEEIQFRGSDLRLHREWVRGIWVPPLEEEDSDEENDDEDEEWTGEFKNMLDLRRENYWNLLSPKISTDTIRNVMDMKANMGSFGAALKNKDVWVMNIISEEGPNTLKLVYDRGLIGSIHNWCEAYSTYPRTYDLLHAGTVFSDIEKKGCSGEDLLIEMDRILRPTGFINIRDKQHVIDFVKKYLTALHWEAVTAADTSTEVDQDGDDIVFIVQKKLWLTTESLRTTE
uniref:Methyltransferase n=3 Tax=Daucus carota subsp. sativus TaxID=79200 RepID=A0A169WPG3_DAUCS